MIRRSAVDLTSIITDGANGDAFIMAGVPWFATLFGRDSIITALSILPFILKSRNVPCARWRGCKATRSTRRATSSPAKSSTRCAAARWRQPAKIPFGRYYGSVDSTPLFLWLYGRCVESTGDLDARQRAVAQRRTRDRVDRAMGRSRRRRLRQIHAAKLPGDSPTRAGRIPSTRSFITTARLRVRRSRWRRSGLRLCRVHERRVGRGTARTCSGRGKRLASAPRSLKQSFERDFWLERERMVALALDADGKPCRVMTSNGAHCLATGSARRTIRRSRDVQTIARRRHVFGMGHADALAQGAALQSDELSQRLGLAARQRDGGAGARARRRPPRASIKCLEGLFDACEQLNTSSLPELFCGFRRESASARCPIRSRAIRRRGRRRAYS